MERLHNRERLTRLIVVQCDDCDWTVEKPSSKENVSELFDEMTMRAYNHEQLTLHTVNICIIRNDEP